MHLGYRAEPSLDSSCANEAARWPFNRNESFADINRHVYLADTFSF